MPYIPKEHEKYDVLPRKRKNGGEAFDYPSKMLFQIEEIIGHDLTPYGYESYEEYYKEVDACAEPFKDDPAVTKQTFCQLQSRGHAYEQKRRVVYL